MDDENTTDKYTEVENIPSVIEYKLTNDHMDIEYISDDSIYQEIWELSNLLQNYCKENCLYMFNRSDVIIILMNALI